MIKFYEFLPIILCGLAIPLSMFMWMGNLAYVKINGPDDLDDGKVIPPLRWLFSIICPTLLMSYGLKKKGVNRSGAILGLIIGIALSVANHSFIACLAVFFLSSSKATKFRKAKKKRIESHYQGGEGSRNWVQVLCNGGMAFQLAVLYLIDCGSGERAIDFDRQYRSSWLSIAVLSAIATCNGDTWASELGTVIGGQDPFLITTGKRVPRGTNGGVSPAGLVFSFLGGCLIGVTYFITNYYTVDYHSIVDCPPQWPLIVTGGVAGFFGSFIDSIIGATMQYSGKNKDGRIVENPGTGVTHISGIRILDNHSVNLISTILTGVFMPVLAFHYWPQA